MLGYRKDTQRYRNIKKLDITKKIETFISYIKKASKSLEYTSPDLLDPVLIYNTALVISQKLKYIEKYKKTAKLANIDTYLYTIGDSLLYYKILVYTLDRNIIIRILFNYSTSYIFVSVNFLKYNYLY